MTTYQTRVFALLRAVSARQWIAEDDISSLGSLVKWIDATGDGPNVDSRALVLSDLGKLALVEHLRVEYWKAANAFNVAAFQRLTDLGRGMTAPPPLSVKDADAALTAAHEALVAAGGEP